jgi:biopolymer transport protein ExbD
MSRFRETLSEGSDEDGIDISPLIDVVFILLIFFIVTTTFVEEPGVEVDKPRAVSAEMLQKQSILIAVTAEGNVVYGGREIGASGVQSIVKRIYRNEEIPVIIEADREAPSGLVIRVVGEAKRGGANLVSVATPKA